MRLGKLPQAVWKRSVWKQLHSENAQNSPNGGCSLIRLEQGNALAHTTTTISGDSPELGIYAIAKAVNDLAASGGKPMEASFQLLLPEYIEEPWLKEMIGHTREMAEKADISIAGVDVETIPAVNCPVLSVTAVGKLEKIPLQDGKDAACSGQGAVRTRQAVIRPGQDIVLCGYVGLEGTLRIVSECETELARRFTPDFLRKIKEQKRELLVSDAIKAAEKAGVSAMYPVRSGGIFAALWELAENAKIGMEVNLSAMSIRQETVEVCEYYGLNPYQMTSAGCILMIAENGDRLIHALNGVVARAEKLGVATNGNDRVITSGNERRYLERPAPDEFLRWQKEKFCNSEGI